MDFVNLTPYFIAAFIIIILEWITLLSMIQTLNKKLLRKTSIFDLIKSDYDAIDSLYRSYKSLSSHKLKIIKLNLESSDPSLSVHKQLVELFSKLIFTAAIAFIGYSLTTSSALLAYLNANKEELKKFNSQKWINDVTDILNNFNFGYYFYHLIFGISLILFIIVANHIFISTTKQKILKRHISIVSEVYKESSQK